MSMTQSEIDSWSTDGETADTLHNERQVTRQALTTAIGTGGDLAQQYDVEGAIISPDETIMWFPDQDTDPIDRDVDDYTTVEDVDAGRTDIDDEDTAVYTLTTDDSASSVVDRRKINTIARALDTTELVDTAKINPEDTFAPVLLPLERATAEYTGYVIIAPICVHPDEVEPDAQSG